MGNRWLWLIGLVALVALGLYGYRAATDSVRVITGASRDEVFYRFKASYTVDKSEKVSMDVVVGCSVELTNYKSGDTSVRVSYSPSHFPIRTKENHVILVQIPNRCYQVRQNYQDLRQDVLPYVQWIESADDLLLGIGYMTEDAYQSPLSRLTFQGMSLSKATRAEWDVWRAKAAEGFIASESIPEPWGFDDRELNRKGPYKKTHFARVCAAMARLATPESLRDWIQTFWPSDSPMYWYPDNRAGMRGRILDRLRSEGNQYNGFALWLYSDQRSDHKGIGLRRYGAPVGEGYPVRRSYHGRTWPELVQFDPTSVWQLDFMPEKQGFANCDVRPVEPELKYVGVGTFRQYIRSLPAIALINRIPIHASDSHLIKGELSSMAEVQSMMFLPVSLIIDRHEHFFVNSETFF